MENRANISVQPESGLQDQLFCMVISNFCTYITMGVDEVWHSETLKNMMITGREDVLISPTYLHCILQAHGDGRTPPSLSSASLLQHAQAQQSRCVTGVHFVNTLARMLVCPLLATALHLSCNRIRIPGGQAEKESLARGGLPSQHWLLHVQVSLPCAALSLLSFRAPLTQAAIVPTPTQHSAFLDPPYLPDPNISSS